MSDTLTYELKSERAWQDTWMDWKGKAQEVGIDLHSDGTFKGKATGRISIHGKTVTVTITDKPWYAPLSVIDEKLMELFT